MLRSETAAQPARMAVALAGLRNYQEAERPPPRALPPGVGEIAGATLRDYGGDGAPVVLIPSLINPPGVLDLAEGNSLIGHLRHAGLRPLLLDWGWDVEARRGLGIGGHVKEIALPLIAQLGEPAALVGYCLGGTMAVAAASLAPARGVAAIAAPWHFSAFPDDARTMLAALWAESASAVEALGLLPMEALQRAFWSLDPGRTVAKFESFAGMDLEGDAARAFVTLEDWANDGPPLPGAAARELFEGLFRDDLPGRGAWEVGGRAVDPSALSSPLLNIVSTVDRIVPAASAMAAGERVELAKGHVGMVVGRGARELLWEPLARWLCGLAPSC
jgi:polyhydroxyalkanoate synthase